MTSFEQSRNYHLETPSILLFKLPLLSKQLMNVLIIEDEPLAVRRLRHWSWDGLSGVNIVSG